MKQTFLNIRDTLLEGDIDFACVVLGTAMICWGIVALFYTQDAKWFEKDFAYAFPYWAWGLNHICTGMGFIYVGANKQPRAVSLLVGTYASCVWAMIAMVRPASSVSAGVTHNFVVIFMAAILLQRSGRVHK